MTIRVFICLLPRVFFDESVSTRSYTLPRRASILQPLWHTRTGLTGGRTDHLLTHLRFPIQVWFLTAPRVLGHNRMGLKWGGSAPFLGLHLTQCCFGRGLPPYQVAS